jgi:archaellum biogenesis ATPase FlaH
MHIMNFLTFVSEVGFPIAGALAAGAFVFIILKFILEQVTSSVNGLKNIIQALDNRVQTMNNDLVKIDTLLSHVTGVKPNVDRIAANEGKNDCRKD